MLNTKQRGGISDIPTKGHLREKNKTKEKLVIHGENAVELLNKEKTKWLKLSGKIMSKLGKNHEKIDLYSRIIKQIHDKIFKHLLKEEGINNHLMRAVFIGSTIPKDQASIIYDKKDELMKKGMELIHKSVIIDIDLEEINKLLEKDIDSRQEEERKGILKEWKNLLAEIEREIEQGDDSNEAENFLKEVA